MWRCVTCGSRQGLQCSHFYSWRYLSIRFDLRNCNAMCSACNRRHNRDRKPYEKYMRKTYGPEAIVELDELRMRFERVTDEYLSEMCQQYELMV